MAFYTGSLESTGVAFYTGSLEGTGVAFYTGSLEGMAYGGSSAGKLLPLALPLPL